MIKNIIKFSVKHPISVISLILVIIFAGLFAAIFLGVDLLPVISCRKLVVFTKYENTSAADIRTFVTIPLEDSFASLKGLKNMTSISRDEISILTLELHWGSDSDLALIEAREIIDNSFQLLPSRCEKPMVQEVVNQQETITVAMIPKDGDLLYGRYIAEEDIKNRFQRLADCGFVTIVGGEFEEIVVKVDYDKLQSKQISLEQITSILNSNNLDYPAGTIIENDIELLVKTVGLFNSVNEIENLTFQINDSIIKISDIAQVGREIKEKESFFLYNGKDCIRFGITKKNDSNPLKLSKAVKQEISKLNIQYKDHYEFVILEDLSKEVNQSIMSLFVSALVGVIVTGCVIFCFLKSAKISLLLASVIPISALFSFVVLFIFGKTLNIMSLSGVAVGLGMVVDAGAVVLENIRKKIKNSSDEVFEKQVFNAVQEVSMSNTGSTITTVIVFIPIFFLDGILGELFVDLTLSIISSILFSCIMSLTYIPAMYVIIGKNNNIKKITQKDMPLIHKIEKKYTFLLIKIFKNKKIIFLFLGLAFFIGVIGLFFLDFELLPKISVDKVIVQVDFENGTRFNVLEEYGKNVSESLMKLPNISVVNIKGGIEKNDIQSLALLDKRKESVIIEVFGEKIDINKLEKKLEISQNYIKDIKILDTKDILSTILEIPEKSFVLKSDSIENLHNKIIELNLKNYLPQEEVSEFVFNPNRIALSRFGISATAVANFIHGSLEGFTCYDFYENGRTIPIIVKLLEKNELMDLNIVLEDSHVPLRFLGKLNASVNQKVLYRHNRQDGVVVYPVTCQEEMLVEKQPETFIDLYEIEIKEMVNNGLLLLIMAIFLLYLIMGAQFESFFIPFFLLLALPPAFSGGILILVLFQRSLNIHGIIAMIILFGTAVNNSILLYESCISSKRNFTKSIILSCKNKLRSILVTNITTICALIPFAIDPFQKNSQSTLSLCIIGGLLFSVIIVLFVIPIIFFVVLNKEKKINFLCDMEEIDV